MFFLILLVAAIILALARGGKITNLAFVKFRWSGLILTGFLIQVVIFTPIWQDWSELVPLTATFYLTSLELLILALAVNFTVGRMLSRLGFSNELYTQWPGLEQELRTPPPHGAPKGGI